ncbi:dihydrofolate reductase family protein [Kitasatospora sp. NPDC002551]|uniref:dihydrofolate reductase family protein n=1 Tax=Kitasatospora sp. NPDC002551 TaxID=3154539 RepID=UPI00332C9FDA
MPRIVLFVSVSLDGCFEGPGRDISWSRVDDELHSHFNEELARLGGFVSGRVTHELMADYWPTAEHDPAATAPMIEFARIWREMPKTVFSRTLRHAEWNTTVLPEVTPAAVAALKASAAGDLSLSGGELAASFRELDLIDEYRVYVHPVLLGRGRRIFPPDAAPADLELLTTRAFGSGVVLLHYARTAARGANA